ncbi:hypothetical protein AUP68_08070 [Ilyonectria robusta]
MCIYLPTRWWTKRHNKKDSAPDAEATLKAEPKFTPQQIPPIQPTITVSTAESSSQSSQTDFKPSGKRAESDVLQSGSGNTCMSTDMERPQLPQMRRVRTGHSHLSDSRTASKKSIFVSRLGKI